MSRLAYWMVIPVISILVAIEAYPLAESLFLSFTNYSQGATFVGAANYEQVISDMAFWSALLTSLFYSLGSTLLAFGLGLLFAYEVSRLRRGRGFLEVVLLMPLALAPVVVGVIWSPTALWDDFNTLWHFALGQPYIDVTQYGAFLPIMTLSEAYEWSPIMMLVFLSIMAGVRKEIYEVATLYGASPWQVFRRVSLPTILDSPVTHFMIVIRFIDAMRAFEIPFTWSTWVSYPQVGSPVDTISLFLFKLITTPSSSFPIGYISAASIGLLVATLGVTTVLLKFMSKQARF